MGSIWAQLMSELLGLALQSTALLFMRCKNPQSQATPSSGWLDPRLQSHQG